MPEPTAPIPRRSEPPSEAMRNALERIKIYGAKGIWDRDDCVCAAMAVLDDPDTAREWRGERMREAETRGGR